MFWQHKCPYREWWFDFVPKDAVIPIDDYLDTERLLDLVMGLPDKGEAIARRAHEFAMKTFSKESIDCYNYFLVQESSKKFPKSDIDMNDLKVKHIEDVMVSGYDY